MLLRRQHYLKPVEVEKLRVWFTKFPPLSEVHALKEGFLAIWGERTRLAAEQAWMRWQGHVPAELRADFKGLTTAVMNWHHEIFNYFENPVTNAFTESTNSLTRVMNRMGRGYSFEVIRARMLYDPKARKRGTAVVRPKAQPDAGLMLVKYYGAPEELHNPEAIEYGAHIPTLEKMAEEGHFD